MFVCEVFGMIRLVLRMCGPVFFPYWMCILVKRIMMGPMSLQYSTWKSATTYYPLLKITVYLLLKTRKELSSTASLSSFIVYIEGSTFSHLWFVSSFQLHPGPNSPQEQSYFTHFVSQYSILYSKSLLAWIFFPSVCRYIPWACPHSPGLVCLCVCTSEWVYIWGYICVYVYTYNNKNNAC